MTPIEKIEFLQDRKKKAKSFWLLALILGIIGIGVIFAPLYMTVSYSWVSFWMIGMLLQMPILVVNVYIFGHDRAISEIYQKEAESALEEKYGRK